ncbi:MAG: glycosyl transferase [Crocinitomicaceae bacterium]|nr:glycosyl transferase [Crocinitomicaceae bacterium]|tara:strand:- start:4540 stop:5439 length:900 start_codon:yes stop_codon:yes gene_type:complete
MLSVLIPIYNFDVTKLVTELLQQCQQQDQNFEILCIDDGSLDEFKSKNQEVKKYDSVIYTELENNIGRAKIRSLLAEEAQYSNLLFLDCDIEITNENFISNYLNHADAAVCVGGIAYYREPPKDPKHKLRWLYGTEREQRSAEERKNGRFIHFLASNLFITRELFLSIPLQKNIKGYGHEDTWLGLQLMERNIDIEHIENAVVHIGLDTAEDFLTKSLSGVQNLVQLYKDNSAGEGLKLINVFERLKRFGLLFIAEWILNQRIKGIVENLNSDNPDLRKFDQWKLYHFIHSYRLSRKNG